MGVCKTYRLNRAISSIPSEETDSWIPILVPSGAVVTTTDTPFDTLRTVVDVIWGNKAVTILTADLRDCATLVDPLSESNGRIGYYRNSN